jgi:hypothetical protein
MWLTDERLDTVLAGPAVPAVPPSRRGREKDTPNVHIEE